MKTDIREAGLTADILMAIEDDARRILENPETPVDWTKSAKYTFYLNLAVRAPFHKIEPLVKSLMGPIWTSKPDELKVLDIVSKEYGLNFEEAVTRIRVVKKILLARRESDA